MEWIDEDAVGLNGHVSSWSGRCPCCGSDQVYEQGGDSLDYACTRCGAVIDDEGEVVQQGSVIPLEDE
jgi:RNA polymerase subunit RPABC4/transcription elongation factor Spt4